MSLHTPLCDLLGIDVPIVLAGMGGASTPALWSARASFSRTVGCPAIRSTLSGCVYAASSCSLCPSLRKHTRSITTSFLNSIR